jgi:hypothetical protein
MEFGEKNDRIVLAVSDEVGTAKIGSFMREYLPRIPTFASGLRFLGAADVIRMCLNYKKTGRY